MLNNAPKIDNQPAWDLLKTRCEDLSETHLRDLFAQDPQRFEHFSIEIPGLLLDYSKQRVTGEVVADLCDLARTCHVEQTRDAMFAGARLNESEDRAVLHTALRGSYTDALNVDGENVADFAAQTLAQIKTISEKLRSDNAITHIVNIGIGGSDLGPRIACEALSTFADGPSVSFLSSIDGNALQECLQGLEPAHTAFIISSKSFVSAETLCNAHAAKDWLCEALPAETAAQHLFGVTGNENAAREFGVPQKHILPMRSWIGGRYSVWGGVGLPVAVACGFDAFETFLSGAKAMDDHFKTAPLDRNMPVMLALLGIWNRNFQGYAAQAILPYAHHLQSFPTYIQQLDMESNGKGVMKDGQVVGVASGPIVFGEAGTNAQHAFMQLLHQSPEIIPADFIMAAHLPGPAPKRQQQLLANALAQAQALMGGQDNPDEPHRRFPGDRPSSCLILDTLDAYHLGMLMALYEHKIFVQGVIWGINSFDQWGVELGKILAKDIIEAFENNQKVDKLDASTAGLLAHLQQKFIKS